jgi:hypothetical protein
MVVCIWWNTQRELYGFTHYGLTVQCPSVALEIERRPLIASPRARIFRLFTQNSLAGSSRSLRVHVTSSCMQYGVNTHSQPLRLVCARH